jgi:membrane protein DedA with SNARE-associated domain
MIDAVVIQPEADTGEPSIAGVSWPAVAAGAVVSCALTLALLVFGTGLGLSVVSPWAGAGVSATTFKIGTGLYLVVIAMLASSIGGYIAGRLRTRWIGVHSDEVYFRDTAHGFARNQSHWRGRIRRNAGDRFGGQPGGADGWLC